MFQYRQVEAALIRAFEVEEGAVPAFRAKIRHLRNLGIPDLPKVGSGSRIGYTDENVAGLVLALELASVGIPPRLVAVYLNAVLKPDHIDPTAALDALRGHGTQLVITLYPGRPARLSILNAAGNAPLPRLDPAARRVVIINISASLAAVFALLAA